MDNKTLEQIKEQYADYIAALGEEVKAKVEACKTVDELTALAMNTEGELPDEVAEAVAGGKGKKMVWCPRCNYTFTPSTIVCPICHGGLVPYKG